MKRILLVAVLTVALTVGGMFSGLLTPPAQAVGIGDLLKIGGIVLVVTTFGHQMNDFINKALGQQGAASVGATKVVPIFSVGRGTYIGAAQVVGAPAQVRLVQGVAAVEIVAGGVQGNAMIPISTRKPGGGSSLNRVGGVGVGAIIDLHI